MSTKTIVTLIDDVDGSEATQTVQFSLDGTSYEIDLSDKNGDELRQSLDMWISAARRVGKSAPSKRSQRGAGRDYDPVKVREWAREQGITVSKRGRIDQATLAAYRAGH